MTLDDLRPLLELSDAAFFNLQYGDTSEIRREFSDRTGLVINHDPAIDPMRDVDGHVAQLAAMDLVVTISNSTAHLAGACGVPTWVFVMKIPDRRWLMDRSDSPWYQSVRLFRQEAMGDWSGPVNTLVAALREGSE